MRIWLIGLVIFVAAGMIFFRVLSYLQDRESIDSTNEGQIKNWKLKQPDNEQDTTAPDEQ